MEKRSYFAQRGRPRHAMHLGRLSRHQAEQSINFTAFPTVTRRVWAKAEWPVYDVENLVTFGDNVMNLSDKHFLVLEKVWEKGHWEGKNRTERKNAYLVGDEESPSPAGEANPPIFEEQAPDTVNNEFPIGYGEQDNYPMGNDPWAAYYTQECAPRAWVTFWADTRSIYDATSPLAQKHDIWHGNDESMIPSIGKSPPHAPHILIDSGASGTVVGKKWLDQWAKGAELILTRSSRPFRFGDGIERPSLGPCIFPITIEAGHTNQTKALVVNVLADVVLSDVPLLISKKTSVATQGKLNFISSIYLLKRTSRFN